MTDTESRKNPEDNNKKIIKWVGVLFVLSLLSIPFIEPSETKCDNIMAYVMFESMGKEYFKSPSTVKFVKHYEANVISPDCINYSIRTHADSQNSFGATVRSVVVGKVKQDGEQWGLVDIKISSY